MSGFSLQKALEESSFEPNAILRGAQLTLVGAHRALQNPALFTSEHYRQAALAVAAGLAIRILVAIPTIGLRVLLRVAGLFTDLEHSAWDEEIVPTLKQRELECRSSKMIQCVDSIPFYLEVCTHLVH